MSETDLYKYYLQMIESQVIVRNEELHAVGVTNQLFLELNETQPRRDAFQHPKCLVILAED